MCDLVQKYNIPGPRYTSYPTVPYWDPDTFAGRKWEESVRQSFQETNDTHGISLYIHLPFCESMCTFCGCHKRITKRHSVEVPYIQALLKEWELYRGIFAKRPVIRELHLMHAEVRLQSIIRSLIVVVALLNQGFRIQLKEVKSQNQRILVLLVGLILKEYLIILT